VDDHERGGLDDFAGMFSAAEQRPAPAPDPAAQARSRRRRRTRGIVVASIAFVIIAAIAVYVPLTLTASIHPATVTKSQPPISQPAAVQLALPAVGESAVTVAGADDLVGSTGANGILASSGGNDPLPIASISKLVTALVVLDAKPIGVTEPGPALTFSKADHDLYDKYYVMDATVEPMKTGSIMSEHDALTAILVASACNYAEAVADWAFGSEAGYLSAVKKWLAANGLTGTKLVEPTGVNPHNVSTPSDLLAIGKLALANPTVAAIVDEQEPQVANIGTIVTTNSLLGVDGVNGIKTGTLEQAGSCLLFSAVESVGTAAPITVIGIVLGGSSRGSVDNDARLLLASIKAGFHDVTLVKKGQDVGGYTTAWKDSARVVAGADASVLTWSNTPVTSAITTRSITTATSGTKVGAVTFVAGKTTVTVPLVLKGSIRAPGDWWRLTHPGQLGARQ
jgi:D-alanyl-D-alanine carboxypeptidase (penicillin-binding protein 5/6)